MSPSENLNQYIRASYTHSYENKTGREIICTKCQSHFFSLDDIGLSDEALLSCDEIVIKKLIE